MIGLNEVKVSRGGEAYYGGCFDSLWEEAEALSHQPPAWLATKLGMSVPLLSSRQRFNTAVHSVAKRVAILEKRALSTFENSTMP